MTDEPIDVDAYEERGVARVEKAQEPDCCEDGCRCFDEEHEEGADIGGWVTNSDDCYHCPNCCSCLSCMYGRVG